jgi:hypothetical protein
MPQARPARPEAAAPARLPQTKNRPKQKPPGDARGSKAAVLKSDQAVGAGFLVFFEVFFVVFEAFFTGFFFAFFFGAVCSVVVAAWATYGTVVAATNDNRANADKSAFMEDS